MGDCLSFIRNEHLIKRLLDTHSQEFSFTRKEKNDFGEGLSDIRAEYYVKGIFRELSAGHISIINSDGTRIQSKPTAQILTMDKDINIQINDEFMINDKVYYATGITNYIFEGKIFDISLEEKL